MFAFLFWVAAFRSKRYYGNAGTCVPDTVRGVDRRMNIELAKPSYAQQVVRFLDEQLSEDIVPLTNSEFLCPDGVRAAIRRGQMLVAWNEDGLAGALRFYMKKSGTVSLYQFAIAPPHRRQGLLVRMLRTLDAPVEAACPAASSLNDYFAKTGWVLADDSIGQNRWRLPIQSF